MPSPTRCRCPPIRCARRLPSRTWTTTRPPVVSAIRSDPDLTGQQRKALEESYLAFRQVTLERRRRGRRNGVAAPVDSHGDAEIDIPTHALPTTTADRGDAR